MLSCKDFVKLYNEQTDGKELSLLTRMNMKIHLIMCVHCRRYVRQLNILNRLSYKLSDTKPDEEAVQANLEHLIKQSKTEK